MPTGLKIPVGVNKGGGAAVEKNEARQTLKLLELAFLPNDDKNPFQDVGLEEDLIFAVKNPSIRTRAQQKIEAVLAKFSDRVALRPGTSIEFDTSKEGEVEISFEYIDLLTNTRQEFRQRRVRG